MKLARIGYLDDVTLGRLYVEADALRTSRTAAGRAPSWMLALPAMSERSRAATALQRSGCALRIRMRRAGRGRLSPSPQRPALFFGARPPAIAGLVVAVVVWKAIDRASRRSRPHVGKKVLEQLPALADFDSASAVLRPLRIVGIAASSAHRFPCDVGAAPALAVRNVRANRAKEAQATAALCATRPKCGSGHSHEIAAIADALPKPLMLFGCFAAAADHGETSEARADWNGHDARVPVNKPIVAAARPSAAALA